MLYITLADKQTMEDKYGEQFIRNSDAYFAFNHNPEWLEDPLVKEMILDVDKSVVLSKHCIQSPVLGQIPPRTLSQGVKTLILMLKEPDLIFTASSCGDNCAKWILEIGKRQDLHIGLGYIMKFGLHDDPVDAIITNDGSHVKTYTEYLNKCIEYL